MKIYTRTGDSGSTALFAGGRVSKAHQRVEAYGTVDELNSVLGLVRGATQHCGLVVEKLQPLLFEVGGELATPDADKQRNRGVSEAELDWLEQDIDRMELELSPLKTFVLPGGSAAAAWLHQARTVCRRAERRCVMMLDHGEPVRETLIAFLNRLSDWLFVAARYENAKSGVDDIPWTPA